MKLKYYNNQINPYGINSKRIETLVDGIFAIAMTLLVLGITIPHLNNPTEAMIYQSLVDLAPNFFSYFLSFFLLGIFWRINHTQFNKIKAVDKQMLYIVVVWLLFVALVPFSASFVGEYGNLQTPNIFFDLNLFAIGFLLYINWRHALHRGLVEESEIKREKESLRANLLLPAISMVAIGLTFIPFIKNFGLGWVNLIYAIIPFLQRFNKYLVD